MNTYEHFAELAQTRKRKLANNTYLIIRDDGGFGIRLHDTEVIIHYADRFVLDSGGWQTVTTKSRMNDFSPARVWSEKGVWYCLTANHETVPFADGVTFHNDGTVTGQGPDPKKTLKLRQRVNRYAKAYAKAFKAGQVPKPSGGDCWYCAMFPGQHSDHIHSHLDESYFVPSILNHHGGRISPMAGHYIATKWAGDDCPDYIEDLALDQITKTVRWYCFNQLGLAS